MAFKYEVYDHPSGRVMRGDVVSAFVPGKDSKRFVTTAYVIGINRKSIHVRYYIQDRGYFEATLKDHQWCFIHMKDEDIIEKEDYAELLGERQLLTALYDEGVTKWEGWQKAVDKLENEIGY